MLGGGVASVTGGATQREVLVVRLQLLSYCTSPHSAVPACVATQTGYGVNRHQSCARHLEGFVAKLSKSFAKGIFVPAKVNLSTVATYLQLNVLCLQDSEQSRAPRHSWS